MTEEDTRRQPLTSTFAHKKEHTQVHTHKYTIHMDIPHTHTSKEKEENY